MQTKAISYIIILEQFENDEVPVILIIDGEEHFSVPHSFKEVRGGDHIALYIMMGIGTVVQIVVSGICYLVSY